MIIGLPGETKESILESIEWYKQNDYIHSSWGPLFLTNNLNRYITPSEFSLHPEKYGYRFQGGELAWESDWMTESEARVLAAKAMSEMPFNRSIDSWTGMLHYSISGTEPKDYIGSRDWNQWHKNKKEISELNNKYFESVRNFR